MTSTAALCIYVAALVAGTSDEEAQFVLLDEDYQVLQRDEQDLAFPAVLVPSDLAGAEKFDVTVINASGQETRQRGKSPIKLTDGKMAVEIGSLSVGGPYTVQMRVSGTQGTPPIEFEHIHVGDLWLLGGQSNMFGIDVIREDLPAIEGIHLFDLQHTSYEGHWCPGIPPIHRIPEPFAAFTLRSQHPEYTDAKIREIIDSKVPVGGIDPSYFFARKLHEESGIPIGLIPCAVGGALAIWDPAENQNNRYVFMLHHLKHCGGRAKGLLFFQGEQDAIFGDEHKTVETPSLIYPTATYGDEFIKFVEALRRDAHNPNLTVIIAQICRHHMGPDNRESAWELIRDTQRRLPERLENSHCIPSIDLDVMDGIHLGYDSLRRVGHRMAFVALPHIRPDIPPRQEIRLVSVQTGKGLRPSLEVEFGNVFGKLVADGRPIGFVLKDVRTGKVVDAIYKVDFDAERPNIAILRMNVAPNEEMRLYYGAGVTPYVNIRDENDMSLPAFGPVEVMPDGG